MDETGRRRAASAGAIARAAGVMVLLFCFSILVAALAGYAAMMSDIWPAGMNGWDALFRTVLGAIGLALALFIGLVWAYFHHRGRRRNRS